MVCSDYLTLHPSLILRRLSELYTEASSQNGICSVCFIPNSDYLATAGQDGQIRVSYRFFAILSRLPVIYMMNFVTLQMLLQQLTFYTH